MERHPEVPFWLCVGDVADAEGNYVGFPSPLYFIKGNNENFDVLAAGGGAGSNHLRQGYGGQEDPAYVPHAVIEIAANLFFLPNGQRTTVNGLRIAGLGGTHAPTMYEVAAVDLPHPKKRTVKATEAADRRRHFVREEVDACKALTDVDVFLSHEAPRPFRVGRGIDAGKAQINEVLAAMQPRLHLFGHHHRFNVAISQGVASICLDPVGVSYLLIARNTLKYQQLPS
jgi:hypothetical protein